MYSNWIIKPTWTTGTGWPKKKNVHLCCSHLFALANFSYTNMMDAKDNQCIVIRYQVCIPFVPEPFFSPHDIEFSPFWNDLFAVEKVGPGRRKPPKWSYATWQPSITSATWRNRFICHFDQPTSVNYKQIFRFTPLSLFLVPTVYRQIEVRHSMALWSCWLEVARVTCIYVKDPGSHAPIGVLWQCQNGAQRQLFTFWQIHADLHGGVSQTFQLPNVDLIFFPTFLARSGFLDGEKNTRTTFST